MKGYYRGGIAINITFRASLATTLLILLFTCGIVSGSQGQTQENQDLIFCSCSPHLPQLSTEESTRNDPLVLALQENLLRLGLNPGSADGTFGPGTQSAVKIFQVVRGLEPTGIVDQQTWNELYRAMGEIDLEDVDPEAATSIIIDRGTRTLTILIGGKFHKQYQVAVGKPETPTPLGDWRIVHRSLNWGSGFGTRWMGLNVPWGIYGIHGTNKPHSIGSYASHGCIRMFNNSVEEIYPLTKVGTPVKIIDTRQTSPQLSGKTLREGMSNQEVVYLQWILKDHGIPVSCDGRFGKMTAWAVKYLQALYLLPITGEVDSATIEALQEK